MINKERLKASKFLCEGFAGLIDINSSLYTQKLQHSMEKDILSRIGKMNENIYKELTESLCKALNKYEQRKSKETSKDTIEEEYF